MWEWHGDPSTRFCPNTLQQVNAGVALDLLRESCLGIHHTAAKNPGSNILSIPPSPLLNQGSGIEYDS